MSNKIFKVGDRVKLPLNETGTIKHINTAGLDWMPYKVRMRRVTFNITNQVLEFKKEQLEHEQSN